LNAATDSRRVLQVLVAVIIALVFFSAGYIASPGKTTTERVRDIFFSTVTETATVTRTMVSTTTETMMVYRDLNIVVYSQDPDINVTATPVYSVVGFISKIRVYVTNNGNVSKTNLVLAVVMLDFIGGYNAQFLKIDVIEPGVTLRYDIDVVTVVKYYVLLLE